MMGLLVPLYLTVIGKLLSFFFLFDASKVKLNILKAKSNFTLLLYIPFLGIGEWYFKCV